MDYQAEPGNQVGKWWGQSRGRWDRLSRIDGQDARPTKEEIASSLDSSQ